jgi:hypothetical protein
MIISIRRKTVVSCLQRGGWEASALFRAKHDAPKSAVPTGLPRTEDRETEEAFAV